MERKISEWLRMIADPEIRKNAWENWKIQNNRDLIRSDVNAAIKSAFEWPDVEVSYWLEIYNSEIALLDQPIPEAEMDALNADPLYGGQKIIDELKDEARRKHEEMRRKLWCDAMVTYYSQIQAETVLQAFDKRFPNHIN